MLWKVPDSDDSGTNICLWLFCYFTNFQLSVCFSGGTSPVLPHDACSGFFTLFDNDILLLKLFCGQLRLRVYVAKVCLTSQAITASGLKKGELFLADVSTQLKNKNITTDVKVDTNSNVSSFFITGISYLLVLYLVTSIGRYNIKIIHLWRY